MEMNVERDGEFIRASYHREDGTHVSIYAPDYGIERTSRGRINIEDNRGHLKAVRGAVTNEQSRIHPVDNEGFVVGVPDKFIEQIVEKAGLE